MRRGRRRLSVVVSLLTAAAGVGVAAPAWACGCGAYIPSGGGASVTTERGLIAWDGARQDTVVSFQVSGGSGSAAWVMPVPGPAEVTLADPELFADLDRITAPRIDVLDRLRVGPFDVTRLSADDAGTLANWLGDNGFPNPVGLQSNLAEYIAQDWQLVAIKLVPDASGAALTGNLQPLRLSFAADSVVYPMRLSRSAPTPQTVDLYVLAEHRMDPVAGPVPGVTPVLEYAGRIDDDAPPGLGPYVGHGGYLTRWSQFIAEPETIDGDYVFTAADSDTDFHKVLYVTRQHGDVTGLLVLAVLVLSGLTAVLLLVRGVTKRTRSAPLSR